MGDRQRCEGGRKRIKERNVCSETRRTSVNWKLEKGSSQERDAREWGFSGELEVDENVKIGNDRQGLECEQWLGGESWGVAAMWKGELGAALRKVGEHSKEIQSWREGCACGTELKPLQGWSSSGDTTGVEEMEKKGEQQGRDWHKRKWYEINSFFPYFPSVTSKRCPVSITLVTATNSISDRSVLVSSTPS